MPQRRPRTAPSHGASFWWILVALGALLAACRPADTPPCPDASPSCFVDAALDAVADTSSDLGGDGADAGDRDAAHLDADASVASASLGPEGGELSLGAVTLRVPAGALATTVTLRIEPTVPARAGAIGVAYELGPSGTTFAVPATVAFRFDAAAVPGGDPSRLAVAVLSADGWRPLAATAVDPVGGTVSGQTSHLSIYALIATGPEPDAGPIDVPAPSDALDAAPSDTGGRLDVPTADRAADVPTADHATDVPTDAGCTRGEVRGTGPIDVCIPPWGWLRLFEPRTFCDAHGCVHTPGDRWLVCYADTGVCEVCNGLFTVCTRCSSHESVGGPGEFGASECMSIGELPIPTVGFWHTTCAGGRCENFFEDGAVPCAGPERCVFDVMREVVAGTRHDSLTCMGRVQLTVVNEVDDDWTLYVPGGSHWSRDRPICCGTSETYCFAPGDAGAPTGTCRPLVVLGGDDGSSVLCTAVAPRVTRSRGRLCCEDGCVPCAGTRCRLDFFLAGEADACPDR